MKLKKKKKKKKERQLQMTMNIHLAIKSFVAVKVFFLLIFLLRRIPELLNQKKHICFSSIFSPSLPRKKKPFLVTKDQTKIEKKKQKQKNKKNKTKQNKKQKKQKKQKRR